VDIQGLMRVADIQGLKKVVGILTLVNSLELTREVPVAYNQELR